MTRDIAIVNNFKNISVDFITGSGAAKILKKLDYKVQDLYNPPSFIIEKRDFKESSKVVVELLSIL